MIEINHLVKKYGNHVAVDDLSMVVEKGKIYGLLGPNGAGKSTTMNIITGYIGASSGEVKINGYDIFENPEEAKRCVGYLPELPPLYTDMTVLEYLRFAAQLKKIEKSKREEYIEEVCELTKLQEVKTRLIKNLSKGFRQRVGLAQAVLGYPEVIILDEPTVGLDPKQIIEIRDLIKELGKKHTVILSSHILSEVSAVCDHVFIISKGKLVASGSTQELETVMAGAQELELTVKGSTADISRVLAQGGALGVSGAEEAETTVQQPLHGIAMFNIQQPEDGICRLIVKAGKGEDVREALFYAFAENHLPILEMKSVGKSLEDIFLELTGDVADNQDADTAAADSKNADTADNQNADTADTAAAKSESETSDNEQGGM